MKPEPGGVTVTAPDCHTVIVGATGLMFGSTVTSAIFDDEPIVAG